MCGEMNVQFVTFHAELVIFIGHKCALRRQFACCVTIDDNSLVFIVLIQLCTGCCTVQPMSPHV